MRHERLRVERKFSYQRDAGGLQYGLHPGAPSRIAKHLENTLLVMLSGVMG